MPLQCLVTIVSSYCALKFSTEPGERHEYPSPATPCAPNSGIATNNLNESSRQCNVFVQETRRKCTWFSHSAVGGPDEKSLGMSCDRHHVNVRTRMCKTRVRRTQNYLSSGLGMHHVAQVPCANEFPCMQSIFAWPCTHRRAHLCQVAI